MNLLRILPIWRFLAVFLLVSGTALGAPPAPPAAATAPATPGLGALTPAQAQQAVDILQDPAKRAQVLTVLQALAKAAPAATPAPAPAAQAATPPAAAPATLPALVAIPLAPDSLGARIMVDASTRLASLSDDVSETVQAVTDFPLLYRFLVQLAQDPFSQRQMLNAGWRLVLVMGVALAAQWIVRRLLRRPAAALAASARSSRGETVPAAEGGIAAAEAGQTEPARPRRALWPMLRRMPFALARLLLDLLPVLALLAAGYGVLSAPLDTDPTARLVILGVLHAYALCRVLTSLSRMMVGPGRPRLFVVRDETALYILQWVRRIAAIAVFGYTLADIGLLFGLYFRAHDALLKLVVFAVHLCLIIVVLQKRAPIAALIRGREGAPGDGNRGVFARFRRRLAAGWHIIAIFYLTALWLVWALDVPNGFGWMIRLGLVSFVIIGIGRLMGVGALRLVDRATQVPTHLSEKYPSLESRVDVYHPLLRLVVKGVVAVLTMIALAEAWGLNAFSWFSADALGQQLVSSLVTIGLTIAASLAVWEVANGAVQRHLARLTREAQLGRSARLRTLLPMLRTALLIAIALFAGLMILSEIGLNIAPLLAGAGVIGLAIGFGSQKLVQDIITGLFLLLENTMQVGDTVSLASLTGTVEALSIRTIRLRAIDGSVHIVPFSAVTTVTNMTRDFAYAVIDVQVSVNEEPDGIATVLRDLAREMRQEPRWQTAITDDLDVMGVDKFLETNLWVMRVRVKTLANQRWAVMRELNRRMKYRFDALGIDTPMTSFKALHQPPPPAPAGGETPP